MRYILCLVAFLVACLIGAPVASADTTVAYPDGSASFTVNLFTGNVMTGIAFLFVDVPGDGDVFIHVASPFGLFQGALWLDFRGFNAFGRSIFDVWGSGDGFGFVFIETLVE